MDNGAIAADHGEMARRAGTPQSRLALARADHRWALAERRRIEQQAAGIRAREHQRLIDAEVQTTRRTLLQALRRRGGIDPVAFLDPDFLAVADRPTVVAAVLDAALTAGAADFCDLQVYDRATGTLAMQAHRGFSDEFVAFFATVAGDQPTACASAFITRHAVLVDDVTRSPIFVGQPTLAPMRAAGTRAVRSYPLVGPDGRVHAVLSLHYRHPTPRRGAPDLVAAGAIRALTPARAKRSPRRPVA
jgi:hypothetical protein